MSDYEDSSYESELSIVLPSDSDSEYETDEDEREKNIQQEKDRLAQELKDETIKMAWGFTKKSINEYLNARENSNYATIENANTIDIVDDKVYEFGQTNDLVYQLGVIATTCNYQFPDKEILDTPVEPLIHQVMQKLIESVYMTFTLECEKDLYFEEQTKTFFINYNDYHRLGLSLNVVPLNEYDSTNQYDTNLEKMTIN